MTTARRGGILGCADLRAGRRDGGLGRRLAGRRGGT